MLLSTIGMMIAGISSAAAGRGSSLAPQSVSFFFFLTTCCRVKKRSHIWAWDAGIKTEFRGWSSDDELTPWCRILDMGDSCGLLVRVTFTVSSEWSLENYSLISLSVFYICFSSTKEGQCRSWAAGKKPEVGCCHLLSQSTSQDFVGGKELRLAKKLDGFEWENASPHSVGFFWGFLLRYFPGNVLDGQPEPFPWTQEAGRMCQSSSWQSTWRCHTHVWECEHRMCLKQATVTPVGPLSFSKASKLFAVSKANVPRVTEVTLYLDEDICSEPWSKNSLCIQQNNK